MTPSAMRCRYCIAEHLHVCRFSFWLRVAGQLCSYVSMLLQHSWPSPLELEQHLLTCMPCAHKIMEGFVSESMSQTTISAFRIPTVHSALPTSQSYCIRVWLCTVPGTYAAEQAVCGGGEDGGVRGAAQEAGPAARHQWHFQ